MENRPNPPGWKGGREDFGFTRTFDGHLGTTIYENEGPGANADEDERRNVHHGLSLCDDYLNDDTDTSS